MAKMEEKSLRCRKLSSGIREIAKKEEFLKLSRKEQAENIA
jgi:hypothetical protein